MEEEAASEPRNGSEVTDRTCVVEAAERCPKLRFASCRSHPGSHDPSIRSVAVEVRKLLNYQEYSTHGKDFFKVCLCDNL